jgi:hypothetical protein
VVPFVSELTLAVGRTKRCSGIWFETVVPSSCFAVHVGGWCWNDCGELAPC